jgi:hypothetical protein
MMTKKREPDEAPRQAADKCTSAKKHGHLPAKTPEQVAAEQEMCAADDSRAMKRQRAESFFEELYWPVGQVLLWIALRDPARLEGNPSTKILSAHLYRPLSLEDPDPSSTLARALQRGAIKAFDKSGNPLPRQAWAGGMGRTRSEVYFDRKDVLRLWKRRAHTSPKINDETAAIKMLTGLLRENNNLKYSDALAACREEYTLSGRGFRSRIWPEARRGAGLRPTAPPGRKPKS